MVWREWVTLTQRHRNEEKGTSKRLYDKSPKLKITPIRACSDGGEIVKIGLARQPLFLF